MKRLLSDCRLAIGQQRFRFHLSNESMAWAFADQYCDQLGVACRLWGLIEAVIEWPGCRKPISIPAILPIETSLEETMLTGLTDSNWLRIAEEIHNETRPTFLVSMVEHRNILVNSAACRLMDCSAEELLSRDLAPLWVPPGRLKPISYRIQLPPHLAEFHQLLKQQSELINHTFSNWKPAGDQSDASWTEWNDDIRFVELDGKPFRLMRINGFEVKS